jgi:hypothetical protein
MHAVFGPQVFFFFPLLMGRLWSARENVSSSSVAAITIATDQQNTLDSIFGRLLWGLAGWLATGIAVRRRQSHTSSASDIYFSSAIVCRIQLGGVTYNKTIFFSWRSLYGLMVDTESNRQNHERRRRAFYFFKGGI